ncbi:hypothetical protein BARBAKC583_0913 [Bartonella bacilliformis KC583]|uniref:Uncharacterized protein n=1 Tax=Bartonella bacilliformis (strain ATCC 35685 / KC583 / Herrer 020/F12,63) TaxID=360095 RepID=A1UT93_BARBK|nr:hypothetical protein BARBAKC583_0913 [Bartonella bacilliformis KC583]
MASKLRNLSLFINFLVRKSGFASGTLLLAVMVLDFCFSV